MNEAPGGVDPKRIVVLFYVVAAIVLGLFIEKVLGLVLSSARINDPAVFGEDWTVSTVIGYGIAAAAAVVVWRRPRIHQVSLEVAGELKKVTWPSARETRAATIAVVVTTAIAAIILGMFDFVWAQISALVY